MVKYALRSCVMGIAVLGLEVEGVVLWIGCAVLKAFFSYLCVIVEGATSKFESWYSIIDKGGSRFSMWKVKMLLIGGRLTDLLVLGYISTYFMSLYKAPNGVLSKPEPLKNNCL